MNKIEQSKIKEENLNSTKLSHKYSFWFFISKEVIKIILNMNPKIKR